MYAAFSLPTILAFTFGVLLFHGQVSEQLSIDIGDQSLDAAVAPAIDSEVTEVTSDQHVAVIDKASKPPGCLPKKLGENSTCVSVKGTCYCYVNLQLTWAKAYDYCLTNFMSLLSIQSPTKQVEVVTHVMPLVMESTVGSKIGAWISGAFIPAMNVFYWTSTRSYFLYTNWFVNEPNSNPSAQCVRLVPTPLGNWASVTCDQWLPFVCQA